MYFTPQGEGEKRRGSMPLGLFLFIITPPSGRGLVIPVFFTPPSGRGLVIPVFFFFFFFLGGHLPQTFARSKQYLPVTSYV